MSADNNARARKLWPMVHGGSEANAECFLAAALDAAEIRGRIAGLKEAEMVLLGSTNQSAYRQIKDRLRALSTKTET
jgi:hypothetical protein